MEIPTNMFGHFGILIRFYLMAGRGPIRSVHHMVDFYWTSCWHHQFFFAEITLFLKSRLSSRELRHTTSPIIDSGGVHKSCSHSELFYGGL